MKGPVCTGKGGNGSLLPPFFLVKFFAYLEFAPVHSCI
jgi:hypothetical protein